MRFGVIPSGSARTIFAIGRPFQTSSRADAANPRQYRDDVGDRMGHRTDISLSRHPQTASDAVSTFEIVTERLSLRPFQVDDLEAFVAYRSDPEVARYQSWDCPYSLADAESFLSSQRELAFGRPGEWLQLAIVDRETGTVCGDCAVRVATDQPATAEVGITLAQANQGRGLATEALTAVLTELFEHRGMHRVFAQADERNAPVQRLLERLGFRCEARLVEADWFKDEWSTLRVYALRDREWRRPTK
jgi:RimJ/RimL family protein N-acetyltransferase